MDDLIEKFKNPSKEFRSIPFWSWNDDLSCEELKRQVHDMERHGMGGFFMHSREGLETEYLGKQWMKCIRETVKEASKIGMKAWLYDEDRWPSGFAGGLLAKEIGDKGRSRLLVDELIESGTVLPDHDNLAAFVVVFSEGKLADVREMSGVQEEYELKAGESGLFIRGIITKPSPWFNGESHGDILNPECVREFINITYEAYRREVGDEFGKTVPGIFTDEPLISHHHMWPFDVKGVPWTDGLPEYFKVRRGYDLLPNLPYLFFDGAKSTKTRHDFWWTISDLFCEAYTKQLGGWCEEHGIALTGHLRSENEFSGSMRTSGSGMPHYQYMHTPGIDILTESTKEILTVKQCASVANQFGRKRVLSEMYGATGWYFSFEGQKWIGDWQYALGVNSRCQHLFLYTIRGCRKRDYPPSFNYHNSWWKYVSVVEDYFARLSAVLSSGKAVRPILVLHPISSAWTCFNGIDGIKADAMGRKFQSLLEFLISQHRDFDLGDETILAEYGRVARKSLTVNKAAYEVVIIPPTTTSMRKTTVNLLADYALKGGEIVAFSPLPTMVEGELNRDIEIIFQYKNVFVLDNREQLMKILDDLLPREISIKDKSGGEDDAMLYIQRSIGNRELYFIANNDRNSPHTVDLKFFASGTVELWNPLDGDIREVNAREEGDGMRLQDEIGPTGSRVYVVNKDRKPIYGREERYVKKESKYIGPVCEFERTNPNVLTLDFCRYKLDGSEWSEEMRVWEAQREIRNELNMRQVHTNGVDMQRWTWVNEPHEHDGRPVSFTLDFEIYVVPDTSLFLVIENAEDFRIAFNEKEVSGEPDGWYLDRSFDKVKLGVPHPGKNTITLHCEYNHRMEVEDCYLIGDFGVEPERRRIVAEPPKLHFGDWCLQGYFHYAGSIVYRDYVEVELDKQDRAFLYLKNHSAVTTEIKINGKPAGHIPWPAADGIEITDALKSGSNEIEIEVMGSLRNMMGPLHQKEGDMIETTMNSFRRTGDEYTRAYILKPYGLFDQVELRIMTTASRPRGSRMSRTRKSRSHMSRSRQSKKA